MGNYVFETNYYSPSPADCGFISCVNCKDDTLFTYVTAGTNITVVCDDDKHTIQYGDAEVKQLQLTCDDKNQYVLTDEPTQIYSSTVIECQNQGRDRARIGGTN